MRRHGGGRLRATEETFARPATGVARGSPPSSAACASLPPRKSACSPHPGGVHRLRHPACRIERRRFGMLHAAVIALSSFLLFLVQPLIAPDPSVVRRLGGSVDHLHAVLPSAARRLCLRARPIPGSRRPAGIVHAARWPRRWRLPIAPDATWKPDGTEEPVMRILLLLSATSAALSDARLDQPAAGRFARAARREIACSGLERGVLAALIGYPFVIEPFLGGGRSICGRGCSAHSDSRAPRWRGFRRALLRLLLSRCFPLRGRGSCAATCCSGSHCRRPARLCCSR